MLHGRLIALSSSFQDRAAVLAPTFQVALALVQVATAFLAFTLIQNVKMFQTLALISHNSRGL